MDSAEYDTYVRSAAFGYLDRPAIVRPGSVRFEDLAEFRFGEECIALMDRQRGIRQPRQLDAALIFRTVHSPRPQDRPYADEEGVDGYLRYEWRGSDPEHSENRALRRACQRRLPLIWFQGVAPGLYLPIYPVWLADEEPLAQQFVVALDDDELERWDHADVLEHRNVATPNESPEYGCTSLSFESVCWSPTRPAASSANSATASCWRRHTSWLTATVANRSCRMA